MKFLVPALLTLVLLSCKPSPKPIDYGVAACEFCKMSIVDPRHAAETVTAKGKVYVFDAIECMVNYLAENPGKPFELFLINDYADPGVLIDATVATYLVSEAIPSPMGANLSGFLNAAEAGKVRDLKGGTLYSWKEIRQEITGKQSRDEK